MRLRAHHTPQDRAAEYWRRHVDGELTLTEYAVLCQSLMADFLDSIPRDERRAA